MRAALAGRILAAALAVGGLGVLAPVGPAVAAPEVDKREKQRLLQVADDALDSARTLIGRGDGKAATRRLAEAEQAYRRILAGDPQSREAVLGLSRTLMLAKRFQEGVDLVEPLHAKSPDDADLTHQLGLHLFQNGRPQDAAPLLERVATDPQRFDAMWLLASWHYQQSTWAAGLPHIERFVQTRPDDTKALGLLGTYYLKLERHEDAVRALDGYLAAHPKDTAARIHRANALFRGGRLVDAGRAYEDLLADEGDQPRHLYNLASVRINQGRCEDAVALLDRFLALRADHAAGLYFKADCELKLGRLAEARRSFARAGAGASNNPWVYFGLSHVAFREGVLDEALAEARKAAELDEAWEITAWLGTLLRRSGRADEALAWHDKALVKEPGSAPIHAERGRDLWALTRLADARAAFAEALRIDPALADAVLGFATVRTAEAADARAAGDDTAARAALDEALARLPTFEPARVNLALLELAAGRPDAAERALAAPEDGPQGPDTRAVRAMVDLLAGRHDAARAHLDAARAGGTRLEGLALTVTGHLAAAKRDWPRAAEAFEKAAALAPADPLLARTAALGLLELGLDRLASGDAAGARTALDRALGFPGGLEPRDATLAELAGAIASVLGASGQDAPVTALRQLLDGKALAGAPFAAARDLGHASLAYALLRSGDLRGALTSLGRVSKGGPLAPAAAALTAAAKDALAHDAFGKKQWAQAITLWTEAGAAAPSPEIAHNIAAARLAAGQGADAARVFAQQAEDGGPAEALYNLAIVKDREGAYREAWELFRKHAASGRPTAERARERADRKERLFGFASGAGVN